MTLLHRFALVLRGLVDRNRAEQDLDRHFLYGGFPYLGQYTGQLVNRFERVKVWSTT